MGERGRVLGKAVVVQIDTVSMAHLYLSCMCDALSCSCMLNFSFVISRVPTTPRRDQRIQGGLAGTMYLCILTLMHVPLVEFRYEARNDLLAV